MFFLTFYLFPAIYGETPCAGTEAKRYGHDPKRDDVLVDRTERELGALDHSPYREEHHDTLDGQDNDGQDASYGRSVACGGGIISGTRCMTMTG